MSDIIQKARAYIAAVDACDVRGSDLLSKIRERDRAEEDLRDAIRELPKDAAVLTLEELRILLCVASAQGHLEALHSPHPEGMRSTLDQFEEEASNIRTRFYAQVGQ